MDILKHSGGMGDAGITFAGRLYYSHIILLNIDKTGKKDRLVIITTNCSS